MRDYLLSSEWVRFAFVLGVAVSMLLYEKRHITTGSIVVPGYIAVFVIYPPVIAATFLNAFLTYWLINKFLRRYFLLYGRTKFTLLAATSTIIQIGMLRFTPSGTWLWESDIPLFVGVGYVVPALIAHDMERQGVLRTTKVVLLSGLLVAIPIGAAIIFGVAGVNNLTPLDGFGRVLIEGRWVPIAVLLSIVASWAVAHNYRLRSGGFVGAAFIGMFMADPWQVAGAIIIAGVSYLIVTQWLMPRMILFGRRKFSAMLLVSSMISWTLLWVGDLVLSKQAIAHFSLGSLALTPLLVPGLLANDAQRTSPLRVLGGLSLAVTFVVATTTSLRALASNQPLSQVWVVLMVATVAILFAPQFTSLARFGIAKLRAAGPYVVERIKKSWTTRPVESPANQATKTRTGRQSFHRTGAHDDVDHLVPMAWKRWAAAHPFEALDAQDWLDEQLAPAPDPMRDSSDHIEVMVLQTALDQLRGVARIPKRPPHKASGRRQTGETTDTISVAPSNTTEAHSVVLGATDHTPAPRS